MKNKKILILLSCIIIALTISCFAAVEVTGEDNIYEALKILITKNSNKISLLENEVAILRNEIAKLKNIQDKEEGSENKYVELEKKANKIVSSKVNNNVSTKQVNTCLEDINKLKNDIEKLQNQDNIQIEETENLKTEIQEKYEELEQLINENKNEIENKVDKVVINIADIVGIWETKLNDKPYEYYMILDNGIWYRFGFYYSGNIINSYKGTYEITKDNLGDKINGFPLEYKNNKFYYEGKSADKISNTPNLDLIEKWDKIYSYISIGQQKHIKDAFDKAKDVAKEMLTKKLIEENTYNLLINQIDNCINDTELYSFIKAEDINISEYVEKVEITKDNLENYVGIKYAGSIRSLISYIMLNKKNIPFANINFTNSTNSTINGNAKLSAYHNKNFLSASEILNNNSSYIPIEKFDINGYAYVINSEKVESNTNYIITNGSIENLDFEYTSLEDYIQSYVTKAEM